jgi:glucan biosynthesis protein C
MADPSGAGSVSPPAFQRQHYIDWLRVLAVLLLFPFHVSRVFNEGELFYVKSEYLSETLSYVLGFIGYFHMQLLFLLAGMSTFYALRKRGAGQYTLERVKRLLVPWVFGMLVLMPPQFWYGARYNLGYPYSYLHYLTSDVTNGGPLDFGVADYVGGFGMGQLWFIFFLFLMSLMMLPLLHWGRQDRGARTMTAVSRWLAHPVGWLVVGVVLFVGEAVPEIGGKNFVFYMMFFVLGYLIMWSPSFIAAAERHRWSALVTGSALGLWWILSGGLRDSLADPSLSLTGLVILGTLGTWLMLVGFLGCGKRYLDRTSRTLVYQAEASYPVYILHQTVIVVAAFYVVQLPVGGVLQWVLLLVASVAGTYAAYEIVRHVGPLRFLFGMKSKKRSAPAPTPAGVGPAGLARP